MNFDLVARPYAAMERLVFGASLMRCRTAFLDALAGCRCAVVLGDGDGRFTRQLVERTAVENVDYVEASKEMLALAQNRVNGHGAKVDFHLDDAREWQPARQYDLAVTHFFLDCFNQSDCEGLVARVAGSLRPGGLWVVSEFNIPASGWRRWRAQIYIRGLYVVFGWLAGMEIRALPDYGLALRKAGLEPVDEQAFSAGMRRAELWRKPAG